MSVTHNTARTITLPKKKKRQKMDVKSSCVIVSGYLLDITFNVEGQVKKKLETLQDVECVARGVGFVFPPQNLLEKCVGGVTRSYERNTDKDRLSASTRLGLFKRARKDQRMDHDFAIVPEALLKRCLSCCCENPAFIGSESLQGEVNSKAPLAAHLSNLFLSLWRLTQYEL